MLHRPRSGQEVMSVLNRCRDDVLIKIPKTYNAITTFINDRSVVKINVMVMRPCMTCNPSFNSYNLYFII